MFDKILFSLMISLAATLVVEGLLGYLLGIRTKRDIRLVILANIFTNPAVVYGSIIVSIYFGSVVYTVVVLSLELLAILGEALIYRRYLSVRLMNPFLLSFILNLASFFAGIMINLIGV